MVLRRTDPNRNRPFRTPAVCIIAPLAIIGCIGLYLSLPLLAILVLTVWGAIGLLIYFGYSRSRSHVGRGIFDVPEFHRRRRPLSAFPDARSARSGQSGGAPLRPASSPASALRSASGRAP